MDDVQGASRITGGVQRVFAILQTWGATARLGHRRGGACKTVSESDIVLRCRGS
jgi:hypothetical protein